MVPPVDVFKKGFLYPTRHVYDGTSQYYFRVNTNISTDQGPDTVTFADGPTLSNSVDADFDGRVLHTRLQPSDVLLVPSSWLVQCIASSSSRAEEALPVSLALRVSSGSDAQAILNQFASDFIPAEWQAMMQSVPTFLNSALQGFIPPLLNKVHSRTAQDRQECDELDGTGERAFHIQFLKTLLQQRFDSCCCTVFRARL